MDCTDLGIDLYCRGCKKRVGKGTLQVYWLVGTHCMDLTGEPLLKALKDDLTGRVQTHLQMTCATHQMKGKEAANKAEEMTSCVYFLGKQELHAGDACAHITKWEKELKAAYTGKRNEPDCFTSAGREAEKMKSSASASGLAVSEPKKARTGDSRTTAATAAKSSVPAVSEPRPDERERRENDQARARSRTRSSRSSRVHAPGAEQPGQQEFDMRGPRMEPEAPELNSQILQQGYNLLRGVVVPPPAMMPPQHQIVPHSPQLQLGGKAQQQMPPRGGWLDTLAQMAQQGAGGGSGSGISVTTINIAAPPTNVAAGEPAGDVQPRSQYHAGEIIRNCLGSISDPNVIMSILQMVSARMEEIRAAAPVVSG
jgi:hypothetical protein